MRAPSPAVMGCSSEGEATGIQPVKTKGRSHFPHPLPLPTSEWAQVGGAERPARSARGPIVGECHGGGGVRHVSPSYLQARDASPRRRESPRVPHGRQRRERLSRRGRRIRAPQGLPAWPQRRLHEAPQPRAARGTASWSSSAASCAIYRQRSRSSSRAGATTSDATPSTGTAFLLGPWGWNDATNRR